MQTILDEARESYDPSIVLELNSLEQGDLEKAVDRVKEWVDEWIAKRKASELI